MCAIYFGDLWWLESPYDCPSVEMALLIKHLGQRKLRLDISTPPESLKSRTLLVASHFGNSVEHASEWVAGQLDDFLGKCWVEQLVHTVYCCLHRIMRIKCNETNYT